MQVEGDVFATSGSDRGIALYDLRSATPIRKLVMQVTNFKTWGLGRPLVLLPDPADFNIGSSSAPQLCCAG